MIHIAPHRRLIRLVVLLLATVMVAPFDEADDYAFLHAGPATAHAGLTIGKPEAPVATSEDGEDCHTCSCLVCLLSLAESFTPEVPAPRRGGAVDPVFVVRSCSAHLPGIFHPPNV
jgi:hypothetical protein